MEALEEQIETVAEFLKCSTNRVAATTMHLLQGHAE